MNTNDFELETQLTNRRPIDDSVRESALRDAIGLNINADTISKAQDTENDEPVIRTLSPDELSQFTVSEKIDYMKEASRENDQKIEKMINDQKQEITSMFNELNAEEDARLERFDKALADPEVREELSKNNDSATVNYNAPMEVDSDYRPNMETESPKESENVPKSVSTVNMDDLVPDYDEDEDIPDITIDTNTSNRPDAGDDEEYARYIKNLQHITQDPTTTPSIVEVMREKVAVDPIPSNRMKDTKILADQAFLNSVTKFKKDNFRSVTIPLVNSGFSVDVVGTGAVDITLLYSAVDQNTLALDYELEKMVTIIRNVVGTHPHIDKNNLRNMIHFSDYQLIAYAHIVATLKDINMLHTCEECGNDFHIVCNSADLILNMEELRERMTQIKEAHSIQQYSLMTNDQQIVTPSGFIVNIGHPSYAEYVKYLSDLKNIIDTMPKQQVNRISQMTTTLPYIRSIILPNKVHTNNLFQRYSAICLLTDQEFSSVTHIVEKMTENIIIPKFGIKRVTCPHCHKVNRDIAYQDLNELLFFHTTVTRLMNETEK